MITLSVAGESTVAPVSTVFVDSDNFSHPNDVFAFCDRRGIRGVFQQAVQFAHAAFAPVERLEAEVRQNPETDDEWVVLRVVVRADRVNVSAARKKYTAEWIASVPESLRFLIRVSPDIV